MVCDMEQFGVGRKHNGVRNGISGGAGRTVSVCACLIQVLIRTGLQTKRDVKIHAGELAGKETVGREYGIRQENEHL